MDKLAEYSVLTNLDLISLFCDIEGKQIDNIQSDIGLATVRASFFFDNRTSFKSTRFFPYFTSYLALKPSERTEKITSTQYAVSEFLATEFDRRRITQSIVLSPDFTDMRPFIQRDYDVHVRYTFINSLPLNINLVNSSIRNKIKKSIKKGYRCERIPLKDWEKILKVYRSTEIRQGFNYNIDNNFFEYALKHKVEDRMLVYACFNVEGNVVSSRIIFTDGESTAIDWAAGTESDYLSDGVTQFLINYVMQDLYEIGISSFDFAGANIKTVAASKSQWGGKLTPYYVIKKRNLRSAAYNLYQQLRKRNE